VGAARKKREVAPWSATVFISWALVLSGSPWLCRGERDLPAAAPQIRPGGRCFLAIINTTLFLFGPALEASIARGARPCDDQEGQWPPEMPTNPRVPCPSTSPAWMCGLARSSILLVLGASTENASFLGITLIDQFDPAVQVSQGAAY